MKKSTLLAVCLAPLSLVAIEASATDITVYGKANVSLNQGKATKTNSIGQNTTSSDNFTLNSNASRLGVKGSQDLDGNLKAIYKMEFEVSMDDGDAKTTNAGGKDVSSTFKQRNIYIGLEGDFGTIKAGKFDSPLKKSQGKVDLFNDYFLGDIKNVLKGDNRVSNIVQYKTPNFEGFSAKFAVIPGEEDKTVPVPSGKEKEGIADGTSASITYKSDAFTASVANDSDVKGYNITRVTGQYHTDIFTVGLLVQQGDEEGSSPEKEQDAQVVSASYIIDKYTVKGQYAVSTNSEATTPTKSEVDNTMFTLGLDYSLSKNAKLFAYASDYQSETKKSKIKNDTSTIGLGLEVKF